MVEFFVPIVELFLVAGALERHLRFLINKFFSTETITVIILLRVQ